MTTRSELLALAERVEKAEGPDWNIDAAIARSIREEIGDCADIEVPAYTANVDAALTISSGGMTWMLMLHTNGRYFAECGEEVQSNAITPALALTAATLRARASQEEE